MQNLPAPELAQRAIRSRICVQCWQRPAGSESLPPTQPRSCEPACPIFENLPSLHRIARAIKDDSIAPYEQAMRRMICEQCEASPDSGEFCGDRTTRSCPLSRYAGEVVDVLEHLRRQ